jgi:hypothetical protein
MADDARRPTDAAFMRPVDEDTPSRQCDNCGAAMSHLSDLPGHLGADSIRVFRCYQCNRIVSEKR